MCIYRYACVHMYGYIDMRNIHAHMHMYIYTLHPDLNSLSQPQLLQTLGEPSSVFDTVLEAHPLEQLHDLSGTQTGLLQQKAAP